MARIVFRVFHFVRESAWSKSKNWTCLSRSHVHSQYRANRGKIDMASKKRYPHETCQPRLRERNGSE